MSFVSGIASRFLPNQFYYPKRKLTIEEMLNKLINEGKREQEEMDTFIRESRTTNELLLKEQNNFLNELKIGVNELSKAMSDILVSRHKTKGVNTRGGKVTEITYNKEINETNLGENVPPRFQPDEQDRPEEVVVSNLHIDNALVDLRASISLMPYTMYEKLGLGEPKPTRMSLELAYMSIQYPRGIVKNVLIEVDKFVLHIDFVILDMLEDSRIPIILGRPFLATARAMIDVFNKNITLRVGDDEKGEGVESEHLYSASANEINKKKPELKDLPSHLEYAYLHGNEAFPVIVSSNLSEKEKKSLLQVLEKHKGAITWKISDIKGISPSFYTHKILMEDDFKPVIQPQRR
ncbi:DNA-directed DNA polymerase [Tanacetum coccineum]